MTDKMKKKKHQLLKVVAAASINQQAGIDLDLYSAGTSEGSNSIFKQKRAIIA